jgi:hypothetical protein
LGGRLRMAYFPNGSAGAEYEQRYCARCVHEQGCAVWLAHMLHNYRDCNDKDSILHILIPLSEDGLGNEECRMFYEDAEKKRGIDTDQKYLDWKRAREKSA